MRWRRSPRASLLLLLLLLLGASLRGGRCDWLQDGGSSNRTSVSYESACAAQGVLNMWSFLTTNNVNAGVVVSSNGTVYATNYGGNVYAIAPGGAQLWVSTVPTGTSTSAPPRASTPYTVDVGDAHGTRPQAPCPRGSAARAATLTRGGRSTAARIAATPCASAVQQITSEPTTTSKTPSADAPAAA